MTRYIWDVVSDNVLMETDDAGETTAVYTQEPDRYGELISQHRDGKTNYYHYDGEGNTRAVTDENGDVVETATYSAFGKVVAKTSSIVNPFGYKGALGYYANPETSDYYVRARIYEPAISRWLSSDPIGFGDGLNLYQYALSNPLIYSDPSGLCVCCKVTKFEPDPVKFTSKDCKAGTDVDGEKFFYAPFKLSAEFSNDSGYSCHCCWYHQRVRGFIQYREVPGGIWKKVKENVKSEEDFIIDENGVKQYYGHRDLPGRDNDKYGDPRLTSCSYSMSDQPGVYKGVTDALKLALRRGKTLRIEIVLEFKLSVIDKCCKNPSKDDLEEIVYPVRCGVTFDKL